MINNITSLKRALSLVLAICLVALPCGCGTGPTGGTPTFSAPATTGQETQAPTDATTTPSTVPSTEPVTEPGTEPTIEPTTEPTQPATEPATAPSVPEETVPPTELPTEPIEETEPVTEPEEETQPTEEEYFQLSVTFTEADETVYATTTVNIRTGPGTEYEKVGSLTYGQSIQRTGVGSNGWSKVLYNGTDAYMYTDYLSPEKPVSNNVQYPLTYSDESCTITITREWFENAWCYIAHLQFTDYTRFGTDCANGAYRNGYETASHAAKRLGAIFTVNGCYSAPNLDYSCVRSGKLWNGAGRRLWCPGVYSHNTGLLQSAWESCGSPGIVGEDLESLVSNGTVTDTFCFGPPIIANGEVVLKSDSSRAQRTFIGTNGNPGDIWVVVSEGRYADGESAGLTHGQCGSLLAAKGCTLVVPLDGGGSSTMVFQGKVLNSARGNERAVVDFLYFR